MKWTRRGHEWDEWGDDYRGTQNIYFYGVTEWAKTLCENLQWLLGKVAGQAKGDGLTIRFVDRDEEKQKLPFCGCEVISPEHFFSTFCKGGNDIAVLCVGERSTEELKEKLLADGTVVYRKNLFIPMDFSHICSLLIWYKYGKLYFSDVDNFITNNCNLRCKDCIIRHTHRKNKRKLPPEEVLRHLDEIFEKVDYVGKLIFGCGDGLIYDHLPELLDYAGSRYGGRIQKITLITNGTIIPKPEVLAAMKRNNIHVIIDDYRDTVELAKTNFPKLVALLAENGIRHTELKHPFWYDMRLGEDVNSHMSEVDLTAHMAGCDCGNQSQVYYGWDGQKVYRCLLSALAVEFGMVRETENEFVRLNEVAPKELLEFILGYTDKGYLDTCRVCLGGRSVGAENRMAVGVQLPAGGRV